MNVVNLFGVMSGLASINRFSMVRLSRQESVLEHIGMVVLTCYLLRNQIAQDLGINLDMGQLLSKAVIHDLDELITGDIARPTKYSSLELRASLAKLEVSGVAKIAEVLNDSFLAEHHRTAKDDADGLLVKVADLCAVVYKIWDEVIMQNNYLMVRQAIHVQGYLNTTNSMLQQLETPLARYLMDVVAQMQYLAASAAALDHPIHGTLKEEIFSNGH